VANVRVLLFNNEWEAFWQCEPAAA
jgi:hypothetical protein